MPKLEYLITAEDDFSTVRHIVLKRLRLTRSFYARLKTQWGIRLDGETARADQTVRKGQILTAQWQDEGAENLTPYTVPFQIPYEDEYLLVIDKPAPLPTMCSPHQSGPTLENALFAYLGCPVDYVFRPVNRLDKGTSGLMAVARDGHAQQRMQSLLHTDAFIRVYLAVAVGHMPEKAGVIDLPLGKGEGIKRVIDENGQAARTHYRVEEERNGLSLIRLRLETGRTHQIRCHLSAMHCPVLGDYLYGQEDARLPGRFALHACYIQLVHPITGKEINLSSPLPEEIQRCFSS